MAQGWGDDWSYDWSGSGAPLVAASVTHGALRAYVRVTGTPSAAVRVSGGELASYPRVTHSGVRTYQEDQ